jgi:hypothetical protein
MTLAIGAGSYILFRSYRMSSSIQSIKQGDNQMNIKQYAIDLVVMFIVVLVVNLIVTFLYGLIVHGSGVLNWESALSFAISLGIILPWIHRRDKK